MAVFDRAYYRRVAYAFALLGYINKRSFKGLFSNTLLGASVGMPLGVCVNCAAPIAQSYRRWGFISGPICSVAQSRLVIIATQKMRCYATFGGAKMGIDCSR